MARSPSSSDGSGTSRSALAFLRLWPASVVYTSEGRSFSPFFIRQSSQVLYTVSNVVWTDAQKKFVLENAGRMKDADIAAKLSAVTGRKVTLYSVRICRQRLGVRKRQGRGLCEVVSRPDHANSVGLSVRS